MIIIAVIGATILAVCGGVFLIYPKCPYCGRRVNFVIPILLKHCKLIYTCNWCQRKVSAYRFCGLLRV